jgi:hypothetical protein
VRSRVVELAEKNQRSRPLAFGNSSKFGKKAHAQSGGSTAAGGLGQREDLDR